MTNSKSYPDRRDAEGTQPGSLEGRLILLASTAEALSLDERLDYKHRKWCKAVMDGADKLRENAG